MKLKRWTRLHIRGRMILVVLSTSLSTLVILSFIGFYGMFGARLDAVESGREIGREATTSSSAALLEQKKIELQNIVDDKANDIDGKLESIRRDVEILSSEMSRIASEPESCAPYTVLPPDARNGGKLTPQLLFAADVDRTDAALAEEIGYAANIAPLALDFMRLNRFMVTAFAASESGFTILTDTYSDLQGAHFDSRTRPWYKLAKERGGLVFSDVEKDALNGELCLFCSMPYERQGEFAGVVAMGAYIADLRKIIDAVSDYQGQFAFVIDRKGRVILSTLDANTCDTAMRELALNVDEGFDLRRTAEAPLALAAREISAGGRGLTEVVIGGTLYDVAYAPISGMGWTCAVGIPKQEVIAPAVQNDATIRRMTDASVEKLDGYMVRTTLLIACVVALLFFVLIYAGRRASEHFVRPIRALSDGVREIAGGNLEKKLDIKTGDEIESLAISFNAMTDELVRYMKNLAEITAKEERIATELSVASRIQENMLPNIFPPFPDHRDFDIYATMDAAKVIGGDFYDFYLLDDDHVVITIADVSGKGIPAALFMVVAKVILKNVMQALQAGDDLADAAVRANEQLCQNNETMMFVTAFIAVLDLRDGTLSYVNAGHTPPVLIRAADGGFQPLDVERNFVLGGMEGFDYVAQTTTMRAGDVLFCYTDGVTEAANEEDALYGEKRLFSSLMEVCEEPPHLRELLAAVRASLNRFVGAAEQSDDITMLALSYKGRAEKEGVGAGTIPNGAEKICMKATLENLAHVNAFIETLLAPLSCPPKAEMQLGLAVEEIFVNIATHAYGAGEGCVTICAAVEETPSAVRITFVDEGAYYDPLACGDPDTTLSAEEREVGKLGVFLAKKNVDEMHYAREDGKNILTIRKRLDGKT